MMKLNKIFYLLPFLTCIAQAQNTEYYQTSLKNGVDSALIEAFNIAATRLSLDQISNRDLNVATQALADTRIVNGAILESSFDIDKMKSYLRSNGDLIWEGAKEPLLVWIVNFDNDKTNILSNSNDNKFTQALTQSAKDYKFKYLYPLMDLDDTVAVTDNIILSNDSNALTKATARYNSDYYITAAYKALGSDSGSFKWSLHNKTGQRIAGADIQGPINEIAQTASSDMARAIAAQSINNSTSAGIEYNASSSSNEKQLVGVGPNYLRMKIANVNNLHDIIKIKKSFVTYGLDGTIEIIAISQDGIIIDLYTNSKPEIVDGTMRNSGDFKKISDLTYSFTNSTGSNSDQYTKILMKDKTTAAAINSDLINTKRVEDENTLKQSGI